MADDKTIIVDAGASIFQSKPDKKSHACLVQYSGTNIGRRYVIDQIDMSIGRSPDCDITVNEQKCFSTPRNMCDHWRRGLHSGSW